MAQPRIIRADGITPTERYLKQLCDRSFLSLWSYSRVFRDQGQGANNTDGKEVCDLIVVFKNDIVLFSDKHCDFPNTGNLDVDWCRWYKRAVLKSAEQIWGAERWIREFPDLLFIDSACSIPFPIDLPDPAHATFHRVVVAHGAAQRCREAFGGGSGSLLIMPGIVGNAHCLTRAEGGTPFAVGQIDPQRGFVHVLDEASLDVVVRELDTVSDFVGYLTKKEALIRQGRFGGATGEEELLAYYLGKLNEQGEHDFVFPNGYTHLYVVVGHWESFERSPERRSRIEADEVSYAWDRLIEHFSDSMLDDTQHTAWPEPGVRSGEKALRFLAAEPRTRRRLLASSLVEAITNTELYLGGDRFARVMQPSRPGDPYNVFLLLRKPSFVSSYEEYREARLLLLEAYCRTVALRFPDALDVFGIATVMGSRQGSSEDALYFDVRGFTEAAREQAAEDAQALGILRDITPSFRARIREYPYSADTDAL